MSVLGTVVLRRNTRTVPPRGSVLLTQADRIVDCWERGQVAPTVRVEEVSVPQDKPRIRFRAPLEGVD